MTSETAFTPQDSFDHALLRQVHPDKWINPQAASRYDLVVVGAGTAGLVAAAGAAGLGARVALLEKNLMGGDCLNFGCVPSKALISSARSMANARAAADKGVRGAERLTFDFPTAMRRMRSLRSEISHHDSAERFTGLGVDVFLGHAAFDSPRSISVDGQTLAFRKAIVATGARAKSLPVPGLDSVGFLTNESLFALSELPRELLVIGAGPIGCEMAQTFARFGSRVTLLDAAPTVLPKDDPDAARIVQAALVRDGIELRLQVKLESVEATADGKRIWFTDSSGTRASATGQEILLAVGRQPNIEGLGLEGAGVRADTRQGIEVDDRLQTTNRHVYAAGDVCSRYQFTHAADFLARMAIQNALFYGRARASRLQIPWCTYTSPEVAHVGLSADDAQQAGENIRTFEQPLSGVDRSLLDGDQEGFFRVYCRGRSDRIVGATIVAPHAGDLIGEVALAMQHRIGLKKIASCIHPYPTVADGFRKLGDQYNRSRLTPMVKRLFRWRFRWLP